jgi:hypothetical protein
MKKDVSSDGPGSLNMKADVLFEILVMQALYRKNSPAFNKALSLIIISTNFPH